jgi:hypothetical protein
MKVYSSNIYSSGKELTADILGAGLFVDDYDEDLFRFSTWHLLSRIALIYMDNLGVYLFILYTV